MSNKTPIEMNQIFTTASVFQAPITSCNDTRVCSGFGYCTNPLQRSNFTCECVSAFYSGDSCENFDQVKVALVILCYILLTVIFFSLVAILVIYLIHQLIEACKGRLQTIPFLQKVLAFRDNIFQQIQNRTDKTNEFILKYLNLVRNFVFNRMLFFLFSKKGDGVDLSSHRETRSLNYFLMIIVTSLQAANTLFDIILIEFVSSETQLSLVLILLSQLPSIFDFLSSIVKSRALKIFFLIISIIAALPSNIYIAIVVYPNITTGFIVGDVILSVLAFLARIIYLALTWILLDDEIEVISPVTLLLSSLLIQIASLTLEIYYQAAYSFSSISILLGLAFEFRPLTNLTYLEEFNKYLSFKLGGIDRRIRIFLLIAAQIVLFCFFIISPIFIIAVAYLFSVNFNNFLRTKFTRIPFRSEINVRYNVGVLSLVFIFIGNYIYYFNVLYDLSDLTIRGFLFLRQNFKILDKFKVITEKRIFLIIITFISPFIFSTIITLLTLIPIFVAK